MPRKHRRVTLWLLGEELVICGGHTGREAKRFPPGHALGGVQSMPKLLESNSCRTISAQRRS